MASTMTPALIVAKATAVRGVQSPAARAAARFASPRSISGLSLSMPRGVAISSRGSFKVAATMAPPMPATASPGANSSNSIPAPAAPAPMPAVNPPPATFNAACNMAAAKAAYPVSKTLVLSFLAGAYIAIGGMLLTVVGGGSPALAAANPGLQKFLLGAVGLPAALSMTVLTGCELFTGNTFVMTAGLLNDKIQKADLVKNWALSYFGNFVGAVFMAGLGFFAKTTAVGPSATAAVAVATMKCNLPFMTCFAKGVLCNWLVCIAVWLAMTSNDAMGKYMGMFLPVSTFVAMGLEHSVANMFIIPQGIFAGAQVTWGQFLMNNLLPVTLGNVVGGAVFVAGLYHVAYGAKN